MTAFRVRGGFQQDPAYSISGAVPLPVAVAAGLSFSIPGNWNWAQPSISWYDDFDYVVNRSDTWAGDSPFVTVGTWNSAKADNCVGDTTQGYIYTIDPTTIDPWINPTIGNTRISCHEHLPVTNGNAQSNMGLSKTTEDFSLFPMGTGQVGDGYWHQAIWRFDYPLIFGDDYISYSKLLYPTRDPGNYPPGLTANTDHFWFIAGGCNPSAGCATQPAGDPNTSTPSDTGTGMGMTQCMFYPANGPDYRYGGALALSGPAPPTNYNYGSINCDDRAPDGWPCPYFNLCCVDGNTPNPIYRQFTWGKWYLVRWHEYIEFIHNGDWMMSFVLWVCEYGSPNGWEKWAEFRSGITQMNDPCPNINPDFPYPGKFEWGTTVEQQTGTRSIEYFQQTGQGSGEGRADHKMYLGDIVVATSPAGLPTYPWAPNPPTS